jgi:predicted nucleotide-binding protein
MNRFELMQSLLSEAESLAYRDGNLDKVTKRAEMLVKKVFGTKTEYAEKLDKIHYSPQIAWSGMDKSIYQRTFESGKRELVNLINVMLEDISLSEPKEVKSTTSKASTKGKFDSIFVVHGHNEEMKQSTARFVEKLGFNAVILHEQPNKGRTIIEKFTDYSEVSFAIVLLSADDLAFNKNDKPENAVFRARQNVILELGFFLGKIGRENVIVLHEQVENLEIPSDYQGVLYVPYDSNDNWKLAIAKELRAVGFEVDGNKLLD